jgi:hypothetical protein
LVRGSDLIAAGLSAPYDIILGSDVLYHAPSFVDLRKALLDLSDEKTVN